MQEFVDPAGLGAGYLKNPFVIKDGYIDLPTEPGLGVEPDEAYLAAHPLAPLPNPGRWFHQDDSSMADW